MNILLLDASTSNAVVGAADQNGVLVRLEISAARRRARDLVPQMKQAAESAGCKLRDFEIIAVGTGPGSFTGLRVALTAVKTLALVSAARLVALDSLAAAAVESGFVGVVQAIADAQSQGVYLARYDCSPLHAPRLLAPIELVPAELWLESIRPGDQLCGPAIDRFMPKLSPEAHVAEIGHRSPSVDSLWRLAMYSISAGDFVDLHLLAPHYVRPSAAEEKLESQRSTM